MPAFGKPIHSANPPLQGLPLQLSRIDYALKSITRLKTAWPWLAPDETCIVITDIHAQYLLNCEAPADSPYDKSPWLFRGHPISINTSEAAVLGSQSAPYRTFSQQLVGTVVVYHPQHPENTGFAKQKPWIFITSLEALTQNHPAFDTEDTTEEWLSIFIHEFFHTRQLLHPNAQSVWGDVLRGDINPEHLNSLYLKHEDYRSAVDTEYKHLVKAVEQPSNAYRAQEALRHWLFLRQQRIQQFSPWYNVGQQNVGQRARDQLDTDDAAFLYIEGVARYVESVFTVNSEQQAPHSILAQNPRFGGFSRSLGQGYQGIENRTIPQGKYYYALGLHLGLLLDHVTPQWTQKVHENPQGLIDSVKAALQVPLTNTGAIVK